jgi:hypothetical protein
MPIRTDQLFTHYRLKLYKFLNRQNNQIFVGLTLFVYICNDFQCSWPIDRQVFCSYQNNMLYVRILSHTYITSSMIQARFRCNFVSDDHSVVSDTLTNLHLRRTRIINNTHPRFLETLHPFLNSPLTPISISLLNCDQITDRGNVRVTY